MSLSVSAFSGISGSMPSVDSTPIDNSALAFKLAWTGSHGCAGNRDTICSAQLNRPTKFTEATLPNDVIIQVGEDRLEVSPDIEFLNGCAQVPQGQEGKWGCTNTAIINGTAEIEPDATGGGSPTYDSFIRTDASFITMAQNDVADITIVVSEINGSAVVAVYQQNGSLAGARITVAGTYTFNGVLWNLAAGAFTVYNEGTGGTAVIESISIKKVIPLINEFTITSSGGNDANAPYWVGSWASVLVFGDQPFLRYGGGGNYTEEVVTLSAEKVPDVSFDSGCGLTPQLWQCGTETIISDSRASLDAAATSFQGRVAKEHLALGIVAGDEIEIEVNIVSMDATSNLTIYTDNANLAKTYNTAGNFKDRIIVGGGGTVFGVYNEGSDDGNASLTVLESFSIKKVTRTSVPLAGQTIPMTLCGEETLFSVEETPLLGSPTTTAKTNKNVNYNEIVSTGDENNAKINIQWSSDNLGNVATFTALDPTIATIDSLGNMARVVSGNAAFLVTEDNHLPVRYERYFDIVGASTAFDWTSYLAGSLGENLIAEANSYVSGKVAGDANQDAWGSNNLSISAPAVTLNSSSIASGFDMSGISVIRDWLGTETDSYPFEMITNQHAYVAWHTSPIVGESVVFLKTTTGYHTAVITHANQIGTTDIGIVRFDTPVVDVTPFKVFPANAWDIYSANMTNPVGFGARIEAMPVLSRIRHRADGSWRTQWNIYGVDIEGWQYPNFLIPAHIIEKHEDANLGTFWNTVRGGDSGGSSFIIVNGKPILIGGINTRLGEGGGINMINHYITEINDMMNTQSGTSGVYALSEVDLTGFTSY